MTRNEIIEAAWKSGVWIPAGQGHAREQEIDRLERFARLVAAAERTACARHFEVAMRNAVTAEREACAKVCDTEGREWDSDDIVTEKNYAAHCAAAIRARGES